MFATTCLACNAYRLAKHLHLLRSLGCCAAPLHSVGNACDPQLVGHQGPECSAGGVDYVFQGVRPMQFPSGAWQRSNNIPTLWQYWHVYRSGNVSHQHCWQLWTLLSGVILLCRISLWSELFSSSLAQIGQGQLVWPKQCRNCRGQSYDVIKAICKQCNSDFERLQPTSYKPPNCMEQYTQPALFHPSAYTSPCT